MHSIFSRAVTDIVTPVNRMLKNANFTKRLEAATKDFEFCKFQFQIVLFRLNTSWHLFE